MLGLLQSENWNQMKMDKTKWYSIDYEKLQEFEDNLVEREANPTEEEAPEEDSEKTKESTVKTSVKKEIPYGEIILYLNEKAGKNF
jgi:hypothetical protein